MKIVQINTTDIQGGAARAAYRLHKGLIQVSTKSRMIVFEKSSQDDTVLAVRTQKMPDQLDDAYIQYAGIQENYINKHRTSLSNTIFSFPYPGYDLTGAAALRHADVINLHWVNYFQSLTTLRSIFDLGKPVVWTLHDQWAFTGGCHYAAGCNGYIHTCSDCPQLSDDPYGIASAVLRDKAEMVKGANLTIVTPSHWLAECVRKSTVFKDTRIEVIPNSIEHEVFYPIKKAEAKRSLDIAPGTRTILFGTEVGNEKRKGFHELLEAFKLLLQGSEFKKLAADGRVRFLVFGYPSDDLTSLGLSIAPFGYVTSDDLLRNIYSAADIFVLPSLEDNLPNTMLESMGCGTPVVSFRTGGMPDLIVDYETGLLADPFDVQDLGRTILDLLQKPRRLAEMSVNCSRLINKAFTLDHQAKKYLELYQQLRSGENSRHSSKPKKKGRDGNHIAEDNVVEGKLITATGPHVRSVYKQVVDKARKDMEAASLMYNIDNGSCNQAVLNKLCSKCVLIVKKIPMVGPLAKFVKQRLHRDGK